LPELDEVLPPNEKRPFLLGEDPGGWGIGIWKDGLQSSGEYVTNFREQFDYARRWSREADLFVLGSPVRKLQEQLDARLVDALRRVSAAYEWDAACGIGPHGYWDNCRTPTQYNKLRTALGDTRDALAAYKKLEAAVLTAPEETRSDYIALTMPPPKTTTPGGAAADRRGAGVGPTYQPLVEEERKSPLGTLFMVGIPAVILVGGLLMLRRKKPKAVAGYRRRKR
jgi:hypothetical protein